ncbi:hypothetical protein ACWFR5_35410 [Streptomyces sp. NPDC055092]
MSAKPAGEPKRPFLDIRIGALRIILESRPTRLFAVLTTMVVGAGSWIAVGGMALPPR